MTIWTAAELAAATNGTWHIPPPPGWSPWRVSYDISGTMTGHLCILTHPASWGAGRGDGLAALPRLAASGAAGIVIEPSHLTAALPPGLPALLVPSTRLALRDLAIAARARFQGQVFAVTGTVGKTTTREMIRHLTAAQGGATASVMNNNNIAGVHRTLASTPQGHAACVLEMGFGKPLDGIAHSSRIARPHVAVLTTIDVAHFDMFTAAMLAEKTGRDWVTDAKSGIFQGLAAGGAAVINADLPETPRAVAHATRHTDRILTFGHSASADARLTHWHPGPASSAIEAEILGRKAAFTLALPGRHMAMNALAALLAVTAAGFDLSQALADIAQFQPVIGRARVLTIPVSNGTATLIDDAFNATLVSVRSAIDLLDLSQPGPDGRRIAVLGEIGHIGADEAAQHVALAQPIAASRTDLCFTWGPLMAGLQQALPKSRRGTHEDTSVEALYAALRQTLRAGDVVVVKSGRGTNGLGDLRFRAFTQGLIDGADSLIL